MFILCDECKNHYDDSFESSKCGTETFSGGHRKFRSQPVMGHIANTQAAWSERDRVTTA